MGGKGGSGVVILRYGVSTDSAYTTYYWER
jgi:hypothetical protein